MSGEMSDEAVIAEAIHEQSRFHKAHELMANIWHVGVCDCGHVIGSAKTERCELCHRRPHRPIQVRATPESVVPLALVEVLEREA